MTVERPDSPYAFLPLRFVLPTLVRRLRAAFGEELAAAETLAGLFNLQLPSPRLPETEPPVELDAWDVIGLAFLAVRRTETALELDGVLDVLPGYEPRFPVPGIDQLSIAITRLGTIHLEVGLDGIQLLVTGPAIALRFAPEWLKPVDAQPGELAEIELQELGYLSVDGDGNIEFGAAPGGTLRFLTNNDPWLVGDTGATLETGELDVILRKDAEGGPAVTLTDATLRFRDLTAGDGQGIAVQLTGARIDATGFSGTGSLLFGDTQVDDPQLPTRYVGPGAASLAGFQFGIKSIDVQFQANRPTGTRIVGGMILPYFDRALQCTAALGPAGRFTVAFAGESGQPVFEWRQETLLALTVDALAFSGGGGEPAAVEVTGRGQLLTPGVTAPPLAVRDLRVAADGTVTVPAGGIGLAGGSTVTFFGFPIELTAFSFGTSAGPSGITERWVSLDGSAGAGERAPLAVSVEKLRVFWRREIVRDPLHNPPRVELAGMGIAVNAGPVRGGGALFFDPAHDLYAGALQLDVAGVGVAAVGILTLRLPSGQPGVTVLVLLAVDGFAPVPLGFGFTLNGVGGLLGVNRTANVDVLRAGVKGHTLDRILFPRNPVQNAPEIIRSLGEAFPAADARFVVGPMAVIGWGSPTLLTLELGIVLELPRPVRLLLLGQLTALLPEARAPQVELHMDALGVVNFDRGEVALDATLYDSRVLRFPLSGDMALRGEWRDNPRFLLAIGGFNPRFEAPADFPRLSRLALNLATGNAPRLRLEAYLAITSNTVQLGARVDLYAEALGFNVSGMLSFDALLQLSPFQFVADIRGQVALKRGSEVLTAIYLELALSGPAPWRAQGKASITLLMFTATVAFDVTVGEQAAPVLAPATNVKEELLKALRDVGSWSAPLPAGDDGAVALGPVTGGGLLAHPRGDLVVRQRLVPLELELDRFGAGPVAGERRFRIASAFLGGDGDAVPFVSERDHFAVAQFKELSDDEKLSRPSFERMVAGARLAAAARLVDTYDAVAVAADITYETVLYDPPVSAERGTAADYTLSTGALAEQVAQGAAALAPKWRTGRARYRADAAGIALDDTAYVVAERATLRPREVAGVPADGTTYGEADDALQAYLAAHPADRDRLQLVALQEVA